MPSKTGKQLAAAAQPAKLSATARARRQNRPALTTVSISRSPTLARMEAVEQICAITNPFCDSSKGAKWPDQSAGQTLAVPVRMRYNLQTDGSGNAGLLFTSRYSKGVCLGTMSGATFTWTTTGAPPNTVFSMQDYVPVYAGADSYRVVSAGVRITPVTSALNSQGIINVIELPPADNATDYSNVDVSTKNYPAYESLPLKSQDSIYAIMRPNGMTARDFASVAAGAPTLLNDTVPFTTNDWTSILVNVSGGAVTSTVAVIDVYLNLEVTIKVSDALGYLTSRAPPANIAMTAASTAITQSTSIMRGTDQSVDKGFIDRAWIATKSAGGFIKDNASSLFHGAMAIGHAYYGNIPASSGHLMMLADTPRTPARDVD